MLPSRLLLGEVPARLRAAVVELVDTLVLGTSAERCEGSSPFRGTKIAGYEPDCFKF